MRQGARNGSAWFAGGDPLAPEIALDGKARLFRAGFLAARTKKNETTPTHPFFDAAEALLARREQTEARLERLRLRLLRDMLDQAGPQLRAKKRERRLAAFDDILYNAFDALRGGAHPWLAASLRRRYPAALIDEFQDTDPLQFAVFDAHLRQRRRGSAAAAAAVPGGRSQAGDLQLPQRRPAHLSAGRASRRYLPYPGRQPALGRRADRRLQPAVRRQPQRLHPARDRLPGSPSRRQAAPALRRPQPGRHGPGGAAHLAPAAGRGRPLSAARPGAGAGGAGHRRRGGAAGARRRRPAHHRGRPRPARRRHRGAGEEPCPGQPDQAGAGSTRHRQCRARRARAFSPRRTRKSWSGCCWRSPSPAIPCACSPPSPRN
ncbi:MAG: UvrD-helicase domain-containing protein [Comamonadaceae bacterium]|nr:UvrD-helicase domain-containing protein [Comamonadaceae bacterium]